MAMVCLLHIDNNPLKHACMSYIILEAIAQIYQDFLAVTATMSKEELVNVSSVLYPDDI